jgi:dolichol-phosphate mannosyltransferase
VSPCFNEREALPQFHARLAAAAEKWDEPFEALMVDDGSSDGTWELVCAIHKSDPRWKALRFSRNFGHQNAISAGIHYARGDCVIVLDSDLQDPPEELHRFIAKWREGYEVVYGIRTKRKESLLKRVCYDLFYKVIGKLANIDMPYGSGDFSLMDRKVADVIKAMPERERFVRGLRSWVGFRQVGIEYERGARVAGEAKYTFSKLLKLALDGIFGFSSLPLKLATYLGLAACMVAVLWLMVSLFGLNGFSASETKRALESTTTIALVMLLGGAQLVCMGILGEYLGRIYEQAKGRPPWIIREALGL